MILGWIKRKFFFRKITLLQVNRGTWCNQFTLHLGISFYLRLSISSAHLLDECEQKDDYVECEICGEAVLKKDLKEHQLNKKVCWPKESGMVSDIFQL